MNSMTLLELFRNVHSGELTLFEAKNYIEQISNGNKKNKLEEILEELNSYFDSEINNEGPGSFDYVDQEALNYYIKNGLDIPKIDHEGVLINYNPTINVGFIFRNLFSLQDYLNALLKKETKKTDLTILISSEYVEDFYDIIVNYFPEEEHTELLELLNKGKRKSGDKLHFRGKGNVLVHCFFTMHKNGLVTLSVQKDLGRWIEQHFTYLHKGHFENFMKGYAIEVIEDSDKLPVDKNKIIEIIVNDEGTVTISPKKNH